MYKKTSQNNQGRINREILKDVQGDAIPDEERLIMLRGMLQDLELKMLELPEGKEKRELGKRKFVLQNEASLLKKSRPRTNLGTVFYEVARRFLPPEQYNLIEAEARRIYDLRNKGGQDIKLSPQAEAQFKRMFEK
jgi:hypothetical protein